MSSWAEGSVPSLGPPCSEEVLLEGRMGGSVRTDTVCTERGRSLLLKNTYKVRHEQNILFNYFPACLWQCCCQGNQNLGKAFQLPGRKRILVQRLCLWKCTCHSVISLFLKGLASFTSYRYNLFDLLTQDARLWLVFSILKELLVLLIRFIHSASDARVGCPGRERVTEMDRASHPSLKGSGTLGKRDW